MPRKNPGEIMIPAEYVIPLLLSSILFGWGCGVFFTYKICMKETRKALDELTKHALKLIKDAYDHR